MAKIMSEHLMRFFLTEHDEGWKEEGTCTVEGGWQNVLVLDEFDEMTEGGDTSLVQHE